MRNDLKKSSAFGFDIQLILKVENFHFESSKDFRNISDNGNKIVRALKALRLKCKISAMFLQLNKEN